MEDIFELRPEDIMKIASGTDPDGMPRSAMMLAIDEVREDRLKKIEEVFLGDAILDLYMSGGAAVLILDFPKQSQHIFHKANRVCKEWLKNLKDETKKEVMLNRFLTITVTPYLLTGQIFLAFNQLVVSDSYEHKKDKQSYHRLILVFDNLEARIYTTDGVDAEKLIHEAEMEMKRYEEELDNDIALAMQEEQDAIREINELELGIQKLMKTSIENSVEESEKIDNQQEHTGVRFSD